MVSAPVVPEMVIPQLAGAFPIEAVAELFLSAWRDTPEPVVELCVLLAGDPASPAGARGVVKFTVGDWSAVVTARGARFLADHLAVDRRWRAALPYAPEALAEHFRAFGDRAEEAEREGA